MGSIPTRDATASARPTDCTENARKGVDFSSPVADYGAMETLEEAMDYYRLAAQAEGRSPRTIGWITASAGYFAHFLGKGVKLSCVSSQDLRRFIVALQGAKKYPNHPYRSPQDRKLAPESIATYVRAVRALFSFLHREEIIPSNPFANVKVPRVPHKVIPTFSEEALRKLLAQPDRSTANGFRDYAVLLLLVDSGLRISELTGLKLEDVNIRDGYIKVMGKGGRERMVPMGARAARTLAKYQMQFRPSSDSTSFFLSHDGRSLSPNRAENMMEAYGRKAGISGVRCSPHTLRHTSAVLYLRNGGDPFTLQKKLGHSSLTMTRHYSELADADVQAAHKKFSPGDRLGL